MNAGAGAGRAGRWRGGIVFIRGFWTIVLAGGGRIEVAICDQADELDHTARSPTSTTQQSTNVHGGGAWMGRGMAYFLCRSERVVSTSSQKRRTTDPLNIKVWMLF